MITRHIKVLIECEIDAEIDPQAVTRLIGTLAAKAALDARGEDWDGDFDTSKFMTCHLVASSDPVDPHAFEPTTSQDGSFVAQVIAKLAEKWAWEQAVSDASE